MTSGEGSPGDGATAELEILRGVEHGPEEEFDLVVAADGVRSGTREIAMPGRADVRFLGLCMAYFTIPRDGSDTDWWRWYAAGEGRAITLRPDRHGTTRVLLSFLSSSSAPARMSPARRELLRAEFTGAGRVAGQLSSHTVRPVDVPDHPALSA